METLCADAAADAAAGAVTWHRSFVDCGLAADLLQLLQLLGSNGDLAASPQAAAAARGAAGTLRALATADDERPPASKAFTHARLLAGPPNNALSVLLPVLQQLQQGAAPSVAPLVALLGAMRQVRCACAHGAALLLNTLHPGAAVEHARARTALRTHAAGCCTNHRRLLPMMRSASLLVRLAAWRRCSSCWRRLAPQGRQSCCVPWRRRCASWPTATLSRRSWRSMARCRCCSGAGLLVDSSCGSNAEKVHSWLFMQTAADATALPACIAACAHVSTVAGRCARIPAMQR